MKTDFAIEKAGGREQLATLLGVKSITTYQPSWKPDLPPSHEKYLKALRPDWFIEWATLQNSSKKAVK